MQLFARVKRAASEKLLWNALQNCGSYVALKLIPQN